MSRFTFNGVTAQSLSDVAYMLHLAAMEEQDGKAGAVLAFKQAYIEYSKQIGTGPMVPLVVIARILCDCKPGCRAQIMAMLGPEMPTAYILCLSMQLHKYPLTADGIKAAMLAATQADTDGNSTIN